MNTLSECRSQGELIFENLFQIILVVTINSNILILIILTGCYFDIKKLSFQN